MLTFYYSLHPNFIVADYVNMLFQNRTPVETKKLKEPINKMKSFNDELTFEERLKESTDMMAKFPGRVPVELKYRPMVGEFHMSYVVGSPSFTSFKLNVLEFCF
ncbi:hypothetical protein Droror1_Dr00011261 [Drosera rotundifolia]